MSTKDKTTSQDVTSLLEAHYCDMCGEIGPWSDTCNGCPVQLAIEANTTKEVLPCPTVARPYG